MSNKTSTHTATLPLPENLNILCQKQLKQAEHLGKLDPEIVEILLYPKHEIIVNFPVHLSNGEMHMFKGYRIQHNNFLGPYKGGLRYHQDVHLDECKALAFWMTIKCALQHLPLGGAKGGIKFNPNHHSEADLKLISKEFSKALYKYIGPDRDIPAPDVGTNAKVMDWMTSAWQQITKTHEKSIYTGKSLIFGGSEGREEATGRGIMISVREWFKHTGQDTQNKTFIVQGFGNVGSNAARLLVSELGMKCIGVGDHTAYYWDQEGLDLDEMLEFMKKHRVLRNYGQSSWKGPYQAITKEKFFQIKTDVVIPAALELQVLEKEAQHLNCQVVVEAANGPLNLEADQVLKQRGIPVIPDVLANSGGVVVSYYEWLQNKRRERWRIEEVITKLEYQMTKTFENVFKLSKERGIDMRMAAYLLAIERINYVHTIR